MSHYTAHTNHMWITLPKEPLGPEELETWLKEVEQELPYPDADLAAAYLEMLSVAAGSAQNEDATMRLFFLPGTELAPVMLEMFEFEQDSEEDEATTLSQLITVGKNERGPHVSDTVSLPDGRVVHRSVGAIPMPTAEGEAEMVLCVFHSLRVEGADLVTRTWVGDSIALMAEVIPAVEELLASVSVQP